MHRPYDNEKASVKLEPEVPVLYRGGWAPHLPNPGLYHLLSRKRAFLGGSPRVSRVIRGENYATWSQNLYSAPAQRIRVDDPQGMLLVKREGLDGTSPRIAHVRTGREGKSLVAKYM